MNSQLEFRNYLGNASMARRKSKVWVLSIVLMSLFAETVPSAMASNANESAGKSSQTSRPNIIFILADDMGYGDPKAYNPQSKIPTPNINRLAEQGMRFTDAHSAGPWCEPSRYGLLTGNYPFRNKTNWNWKTQSIIKPDQSTLASLLSKGGYQTGMVGKWHEGFSNFNKWNSDGYQGPLKGGPTDRGFDYYYGIPASLDLPPYFYIENDHAVHPPTNSIRAHHSKGVTPIQGVFWNAGKIAPGFKFPEVLPRLTRKALRFIDQQEASSKKTPFFLYFALPAPHTPWVPIKRFWGSSGAGTYGDFVVQVDHVVGQIMKKIKRDNLENNTLFIFASDNGPVWYKQDVKRYDHRSTAMLRGMKMDAWEGGHRIPFIARWPGNIKAGSTSHAILDFTDMMATLAAVSGTKISKNSFPDSDNQLPILEGKRSSVRSVLPDANSIREGNWTLIVPNGLGPLHRHYGEHKRLSKTGELYNLKHDISEENNLYSKYPKKVEQLKKLMKTLKKN